MWGLTHNVYSFGIACILHVSNLGIQCTEADVPRNVRTYLGRFYSHARLVNLVLPVRHAFVKVKLAYV